MNRNYFNRLFFPKQWLCWYCYMDALHESCEQYWTGPGGNTTQSSSYTATYPPSGKLSKLDERDMQDTDGEVGTSWVVMYSNGPLHVAEQKHGNQLEPTYISSVRIQDVALRTCLKQWTIGRSGEKGSGISVPMTGQDHDDDDNAELNQTVNINIYFIFERHQMWLIYLFYFFV